MKTLLSSKGRTFRSILSMLCLALLFPVMAMGQTKASGVVIDNFGDPVLGASVVEKGTTNGCTTDLDGKFELTVNKGATLVISFVGFTSQELKAAANMNVTLEEDSKTLEETIVVGYGVQKKSSLTGAVSQVKSEDMQARTITDANQALQGKTAGVQVLSSSAKPGASLVFSSLVQQALAVRQQSASVVSVQTVLLILFMSSTGVLQRASAVSTLTISSQWKY